MKNNNENEASDKRKVRVDDTTDFTRRAVVIGGASFTGEHRARHQTEPRRALAFEFLADNPGDWLFHCHHAYHLAAGMARVFKYV